MSIKEQTGYAVECDFPDCDVKTQDLGEYAFWGDFGTALDEWIDHDGYAGDLGQYCFEHTVWVEDEEEGIDERRPMPHTIDSLFLLAERRIAAKISFYERAALYNLGTRVRHLADRQSSRIAGAQRRFGADLVEARRRAEPAA